MIDLLLGEVALGTEEAAIERSRAKALDRGL
jgi:hypothetical protein